MRRAGLAGCALAAAAILAGAASCGGSGGDDGVELTLELVTPDNNIRIEGSECAGARPFQYVHARSAFTLETENGDVLYEGELPTGAAQNADPTIDWESERMPTVCVFELDLGRVAEAPRYVLAVEGGEPLPFDGALVAPGRPVRLFAR